MSEKKKSGVEHELAKKSDALTDLALTLPIFVAYHLGVVFLPIRNAADPVTSELRTLANQSIATYAGITLAIGAAFVVVCLFLGDRRALDKRRFAFVALEGMLYAVLMRLAGTYAVGHLRLGPAGELGLFGSVVMALGAGFYEEIAFRVILFGGAAWIIKKLFKSSVVKLVLQIVAGVVVACAFSAWHYVGSLGDAFDVKSFVFRAVCGGVLCAIYALRGFAPAVWTHAIYDVWVMVLG